MLQPLSELLQQKVQFWQSRFISNLSEQGHNHPLGKFQGKVWSRSTIHACLSSSLKFSSSPDSIIYFHKDDIICVVGFLFLYFFIFELQLGSGSRGSGKILEDSLGMLLGGRAEDSVHIAIL